MDPLSALLKVASALFGPVSGVVQQQVAQQMIDSDSETAQELGEMIQREMDQLKDSLKDKSMMEFNGSLIEMQHASIKFKEYTRGGNEETKRQVLTELEKYLDEARKGAGKTIRLLKKKEELMDRVRCARIGCLYFLFRRILNPTNEDTLHHCLVYIELALESRRLRKIIESHHKSKIFRTDASWKKKQMLFEAMLGLVGVVAGVLQPPTSSVIPYAEYLLSAARPVFSHVVECNELSWRIKMDGDSSSIVTFMNIAGEQQASGEQQAAGEKCTTGLLTIFDKLTGKFRDKFSTPSGFNDLSCDKTSIYCTNFRGGITAYDKSSHNPRPLGVANEQSAIYHKLVVDGDSIITDRKDAIVILDKHSGTTRGVLEAGKVHDFVVHGSDIFTVTDRSVSIWNKKTGVERLVLQTGVRTHHIAVDDHIIVTSHLDRTTPKLKVWKLKVWNRGTLECQATCQFTEELFSVAIFHGIVCLCGRGLPGGLVFWNWETGHSHCVTDLEMLELDTGDDGFLVSWGYQDEGIHIHTWGFPPLDQFNADPIQLLIGNM